MSALLVVRPSSLGDIVHALSLVSDVVAHRPSCAIDWVAEEGFLPLVRLDPRIRNVKIADGFNSNAALFRYARDLGNKRADMYDIAVFDETIAKSGREFMFAINIPQEMIHYGMTKTAQLAISRGLAELTKGAQVTVNTVAPGPTASEGVIDFVKSMAQARGQDEKAVEEEFFKTVRPTSLLQRFEDPIEIAQTIVFLASPLSSAINGAVLRADGGVVKSAF